MSGEVFVGVAVGLLVTLWIERLRVPRLRIDPQPELVDTVDFLSYRVTFGTAKAIRARLANPRPGGPMSWVMTRDAARDCQAIVRLERMRDGYPAFWREHRLSHLAIQGRWSRSDQPAPLSGFVYPLLDDNATSRVEIDDHRVLRESRIDIPAGGAESLDLVVIVDATGEAFAWSNDNYKYKGFLPDKWRIREAGNYAARIEVRHDGRVSHHSLYFEIPAVRTNRTCAPASSVVPLHMSTISSMEIAFVGSQAPGEPPPR